MNVVQHTAFQTQKLNSTHRKYRQTTQSQNHTYTSYTQRGYYGLRRPGRVITTAAHNRNYKL